MITIKNGDLLQAEENIIGHQVNCKGAMGAGLARQIKKKYPHTFNVYVETCDLLGSSLLGTCQIVSETDGKHIANLFGQDDYGTYKRMTDYEALRKALVDLCERAKKDNLSVALPYMIGCSLGGGDWEVVYKMIDEVFADYQVTLYKL